MNGNKIPVIKIPQSHFSNDDAGSVRKDDPLALEKKCPKTKEAKKLRAEYPIEGYPCYFYMSPKGKLLRQTNTFMFSAQLKKDAEKALKKFHRGF